MPTTLRGILEALDAGQCTAVELARQVIDRSARLSHLNAIIGLDAGLLLARAREADQVRAAGRPVGALHGAPVMVKDNIDTRDYPTTAGTSAFIGEHPRKDAPVVRRLLDAGALLAGKTNLHELAVGGTSENIHFGDVDNPWRPGFIAGGSSGGSAVVVAAGIVPASLGTDANGSVRGPAALCGVAGFRPTPGRYPYGGIIPPTPTRDTPGIFTSTVDDLLLLDAVLSAAPADVPDTALAGLRLGRLRERVEDVLDPRTAAVIDEAIGLMIDHGAVLVDIDIPDLAGLSARAAWPISAFEVIREMPGYLAGRGSTVTLDALLAGIGSPAVRQRFTPRARDAETHRRLEAAWQEAMTIHRPRLQQVLADCFRTHRIDALVYPTVPFPAVPFGPDDGHLEIDGRKISMGQLIRNTVHQSAAGIPSLSVPAGLTHDGLPVGIGFDGPARSDRRLLAIGRAFETARGAFPAPPV